jgi:pimeloyl-ACP methyl ester carboxylesterase
MSEPACIEEEISHGHAVLEGGVRLHYVEVGEGPLLVLLHGFPEFWYSWRRQLLPLAAAGFHVVAPDMRGYNLSDKPSGWRAYDMKFLAGDIAALIRHFGVERADVVGHDWGAAVGYGVAALHPDSVRRLAILNVPHPARMLAGLKTFKQLRKTWYMFFFQLPSIPEWLLRRDRFSMLKRAMRVDRAKLGKPAVFGDEVLERYAQAWSQPGALTAMLGYYRAALRQAPRAAGARMRPIVAPTLVIWGDRDTALGPELAEPEARWVKDVRVVHLPEATHWVQHDDPERVNELLTEFLSD